MRAIGIAADERYSDSVTPTMPQLTVVGAGRVGKALCRLWREQRVFTIGDVLNRRPGSARAAVSFIGAGRPVEDWSKLGAADVLMLSVPDDAIAACVEKLKNSKAVAPGAIVFHCSGSAPSSVLAPLESTGARIASMHPVKSFADPAEAAESFEGTHCALEGDFAACALLEAAIERCGGRAFNIDTAYKLTYHAGTVFASNYLVGLMEVALACFERAGVDRERARSIALPLALGTLGNVGRLGTADALTGPIARGDSALVGEQLRALEEWDEEIGRLYANLGRYALELSARQGSADPASLERIRELLRKGARSTTE